MNFKNKGQGTIEYLIIIAIVVVIALVVIGLMLSLNPGAGISKEQAKIEWEKATDWGISDWYSDETTLTIELVNNTEKSFTLNSIVINGTTNNPTSDVVFAGGEKKIFTFNKECTTGYIYNDILITYSSSFLSNLKQEGKTPLVGTCVN